MRDTCATRVVPYMHGILDTGGDFSTTKPPKHPLVSGVRCQGRGEADFTPPQPAANVCALSHPITSFGNRVGYPLFTPVSGFDGVSDPSTGWMR